MDATTAVKIPPQHATKINPVYIKGLTGLFCLFSYGFCTTTNEVDTIVLILYHQVKPL